MMPAMQRPLRILAMADMPPDANAGAPGAEVETIRALRELGHHVDDVWQDTLGRRIGHGNLHALLELPRRFEAVAEERLSQSEYDVVHVNQPHGYRAARLIQRRWPRTAFIHRSHGWEPRVREVLRHWRMVYGEEARSPLRRAASGILVPMIARHATEIVRWADGHILCSHHDADYMHARNGVPPEKLGVMPQAPPDSFNATAAPPMTAARLRHVLHVGQFAFVKAPMITAGVMNEIAQQRPEVRFTWVAGREHHERIRALLNDAVRARLDLRGWTNQEALRDVYDSAGVFLFPSFFEGSGKAHIEALSRGLCVVASRTGGMRDYVEDGRSGILIEPGDTMAIARAAIALIDDLDAATAMSSAAAARAREYSWRRAAEETVEFYRRRIAAKQSA
jgi:glycosyltransferase involved in cell wall biosynthesis